MNGFNTFSNENLSAFDVRRLMPRATLNELSTVDGVKTTVTIAGIWSVIALLIVVAVHSSTVVISVVAVILIAGRQHALLVLMHDGAHRLLYTDRTTNDVISNVFLSFPLFVSTELYRRHHLSHHRHTNTEDDPDLADSEVPENFRALLLSLLGDLVGLRSLRLLSSLSSFGVTGIFGKEAKQLRANGLERRYFLGFVVICIVLLTFFGLWAYFLIYWIVPMWFILPALLHLRAIGEHAGRTSQHVLSHARSVRANLLERALICPMNVNLHLEHHLFPEVPSFRLRKITEYLEGEPKIKSGLVRTNGYLFGRTSVVGEIYFSQRAMEGLSA